MATGLLFPYEEVSAMTRNRSKSTRVALAVVVPAWLLAVPVLTHAQGRGETRGGGHG